MLAVTACPTGIAHTYMAAEALEAEAAEMHIAIKVETNGADGVKNHLTEQEIENAECIIVAADKAVETARFAGKPVLRVPVSQALKDPEMLQIALRPAVELSYLRKEEQADLFAIMDEMDCTPSHAQAIKMRQMSEAKTGGERLAKDALVSIMKEEKPNQKEQFKIPKEKISRFFAPGTPTQKIEDTIVKALELYRKRQRSLER